MSPSSATGATGTCPATSSPDRGGSPGTRKALLEKPASREFYFNGDFDWTLRGKASLLEGDDPTFVHEMANHFLFSGSASDTLVLHAPLPEAFRDYLSGKALEIPGQVIHPAFSPAASFTPFGWNSHTATLNRRYAHPVAHPGLEAVRRANSRVFGHSLQREWESEEGRGARFQGHLIPASELFDSLKGLEGYLNANPFPPGWMVKGNHGHAGTANRRIMGSCFDEEERQAVKILLEENGWVALEPWHDRVLDLSANFRVDRQGRVEDFRGHTLVNSRDGAFLGVQVEPAGQPPREWGPALEKAAARLAESLSAIGYFGPVSMDAYAFRTDQGIRLRPWVDINARLSMALPAHGLAQRLPDRFIRWIWAKPKKLRLPSTYAELGRALGSDDFNPSTRIGIVAVSPLEVQGPGGEGRRPKRVSFALCGRDESDLSRLQQAYLSALVRA